MKEYLKEQLKKLEVPENEKNRAEWAYEQNPLDSQKGQALDEAYKKEQVQYIFLSQIIEEFTSEKIESETAWKMLKDNREGLVEILYGKSERRKDFQTQKSLQPREIFARVMEKQISITTK